MVTPRDVVTKFVRSRLIDVEPEPEDLSAESSWVQDAITKAEEALPPGGISGFRDRWAAEYAGDLLAALDEAGLEIREKNTA